MVARGQTAQVQDACLDLDPKPRTVSRVHSFLSCLISHKVILGICLVSESSDPSTAALYTFYAERCHRNLLCPSELAQQAHPRNHYPSWTVLGSIFKYFSLFKTTVLPSLWPTANSKHTLALQIVCNFSIISCLDQQRRN